MRRLKECYRRTTDDLCNTLVGEAQYDRCGIRPNIFQYLLLNYTSWRPIAFLLVIDFQIMNRRAVKQKRIDPSSYFYLLIFRVLPLTFRPSHRVVFPVPLMKHVRELLGQRWKAKDKDKVGIFHGPRHCRGSLQVRKLLFFYFYCLFFVRYSAVLSSGIGKTVYASYVVIWTPIIVITDVDADNLPAIIYF